jgi:Pyruvate/2-oxoacid:ferredoxin oxidoreductase gamma subunit
VEALENTITALFHAKGPQAVEANRRAFALGREAASSKEDASFKEDSSSKEGR